MPQSKSAIKRMRSDETKRVRNQSTLTKLKTNTKKLTKELETNDIEAAKKQGAVTAREFDKAASRGIIPKKRADRKKSRIAKSLNKLASTQTTK